MYITSDCKWTPYGTDLELDKLVDSNNWKIRSEIAEKGYC